MSARSLMVTLSLGDRKTGLWCPVCNLPSVVAISIYTLTELGVGEPIWCAKCTDCKLGFPMERCL
jgi:hypothetical protein